MVDIKKENIPSENKKNSKKKETSVEKTKESKSKVFSKKLSKEQIKIQELEKQIEELKNDYLRSRADFENFRKRTQEELAQAKENGKISFVEDLLPSIDNFEMSLKMTDNKEMFIKGVEMIHKNLIDTLKEHKFEHFEATKGQEFNPNLHDPILIEDETNKEGTIIGTIKKGYKHKDKIIRAAKVQVVKENQNKDN